MAASSRPLILRPSTAPWIEAYVMCGAEISLGDLATLNDLPTEVVEKVARREDWFGRREARCQERRSILLRLRDFVDEQLREPSLDSPRLSGSLVIAECMELFRRVEAFQNSLTGTRRG